MDEGHKRVLAIVAAILAARKLASLDPKPSPALNLAIAEAVEKAEQIMRKLDNVFPALSEVVGAKQNAPDSQESWDVRLNSPPPKTAQTQSTN